MSRRSTASFVSEFGKKAESKHEAEKQESFEEWNRKFNPEREACVFFSQNRGHLTTENPK